MSRRRSLRLNNKVKATQESNGDDISEAPETNSPVATAIINQNPSRSTITYNGSASYGQSPTKSIYRNHNCHHPYKIDDSLSPTNRVLLNSHLRSPSTTLTSLENDIFNDQITFNKFASGYSTNRLLMGATSSTADSFSNNESVIDLSKLKVPSVSIALESSSRAPGSKRRYQDTITPNCTNAAHCSDRTRSVRNSRNIYNFISSSAQSSLQTSSSSSIETPVLQSFAERIIVNQIPTYADNQQQMQQERRNDELLSRQQQSGVGNKTRERRRNTEFEGNSLTTEQQNTENAQPILLQSFSNIINSVAAVASSEHQHQRHRDELFRQSKTRERRRNYNTAFRNLLSVQPFSTCTTHLPPGSRINFSVSGCPLPSNLVSRGQELRQPMPLQRQCCQEDQPTLVTATTQTTSTRRLRSSDRSAAAPPPIATNDNRYTILSSLIRRSLEPSRALNSGLLFNRNISLQPTLIRNQQQEDYPIPITPQSLPHTSSCILNIAGRQARMSVTVTPQQPQRMATRQSSSNALVATPSQNTATDPNDQHNYEPAERIMFPALPENLQQQPTGTSRRQNRRPHRRNNQQRTTTAEVATPNLIYPEYSESEREYRIPIEELLRSVNPINRRQHYQHYNRRGRISASDLFDLTAPHALPIYDEIISLEENGFIPNEFLLGASQSIIDQCTLLYKYIPLPAKDPQTAERHQQHSAFSCKRRKIPAMIEKCSICLEVMLEGEQVRRLPCLHLYHGKCIDKWLSMNRRCPVCRFDIVTGHADELEESQSFDEFQYDCLADT
ncbi:hypothetical protein GJ496_007307 [Pomphorhynchus laevis]|nr:hypothetical protein GJ496_007307 [Pomphorhynchus laevis]